MDSLFCLISQMILRTLFPKMETSRTSLQRMMLIALITLMVFFSLLLFQSVELNSKYLSRYKDDSSDGAQEECKESDEENNGFV